MDMDKMLAFATVKEHSDVEKTLVAWASKPVVDRQNEVIDPFAWDLKDYQKNPVLMLSHDYKQLPVGKTLWIKATPDGLKFKAKFANTATGNELYELYKDDIMKGFSVGFSPKEKF